MLLLQRARRVFGLALYLVNLHVWGFAQTPRHFRAQDTLVLLLQRARRFKALQCSHMEGFESGLERSDKKGEAEHAPSPLRQGSPMQPQEGFESGLERSDIK
jgi:hypothetical protein